ncbi:hypothetical protein LCGC14_1351730 [marine sediment metagenome]|uniref:Uncharacterized protein n=1 Tax=marine sediment metagenome TaxID=412755 RepID=A0A0F9KAT2_9ZZZZ
MTDRQIQTIENLRLALGGLKRKYSEEKKIFKIKYSELVENYYFVKLRNDYYVGISQMPQY